MDYRIQLHEEICKENNRCTTGGYVLSDKIECVEEIAREATKILGSDIHPIELDKRIGMTPVSNVEWSGLRGQSYCKPTSPDVKELLKQHGVDGISYNLKGEPDFSTVAIEKVKISDMTENMGHDYTSTINKLLETDFAKRNGINTPTEMREYMSEHDLTIHEGQDGVTEYLVERLIHQTFRHYGGRGKLRGFENPDSNRIIQSKLSEGAVNVNKMAVKGLEKFDNAIDCTNDFIEQQTAKFLTKDLSELNRAGVDEATKAAIFAATLSVTQNAISVANGKKDAKEATKNVLVDISSVAVLSYATGVTKKALNLDNRSEAALIVTGTVQISKQVFAYCSGEIDERQLLENVAETSAYLASAYIGKMIGATVGGLVLPGPIGSKIGEYVGEMITTAFCSTVIDTIHYEKGSIRYEKRMMALAKRAEREILMSQERLEYIVREKNNEIIDALNKGYDKFIEGIQFLDYETASSGLMEIGMQFGIEAENFTQGHVTKGNIFGKKNRVINLL